MLEWKIDFTIFHLRFPPTYPLFVPLLYYLCVCIVKYTTDTRTCYNVGIKKHANDDVVNAIVHFANKLNKNRLCFSTSLYKIFIIIW